VGHALGLRALGRGARLRQRLLELDLERRAGLVARRRPPARGLQLGLQLPPRRLRGVGTLARLRRSCLGLARAVVRALDAGGCLGERLAAGGLDGALQVRGTALGRLARAVRRRGGLLGAARGLGLLL
jgi:hypothetical protein